MRWACCGFLRPTARLLQQQQQPLVLGLESSADDTCAAVVQGTQVLSNVVLKQQGHEAHGGIHPHLAQREHQRQMPLAVRQALAEAKVDLKELSAVGYTRGPGMAACLRVCSNAGRTLAAALNVPSIGVHHMQAHTLTALFTESQPPKFPFLTLLVSGGHTLVVLATSQTDFQIMATTVDASIGDSFDKISRLLGCGWSTGSNRSPGAALEHLASQHQQEKDPLESFPANVLPGQLSFSYSGLRSAVERYVQERAALSPAEKARTAASFQHAAIKQLETKLALVLDQLQHEPISALVCSGGVASNAYLRARLRTMLDESGRPSMKLMFPPVHLCTDNAAMIAFVASERLKRGSVDPHYEHNFLPKW